jgi:hypothetical protein
VDGRVIQQEVVDIKPGSEIVPGPQKEGTNIICVFNLYYCTILYILAALQCSASFFCERKIYYFFSALMKLTKSLCIFSLNVNSLIDFALLCSKEVPFCVH